MIEGDRASRARAAAKSIHLSQPKFEPGRSASLRNREHTLVFEIEGQVRVGARAGAGLIHVAVGVAVPLSRLTRYA